MVSCKESCPEGGPVSCLFMSIYVYFIPPQGGREPATPSVSGSVSTTQSIPIRYLRMIESMSTAASVKPEDWEQLRELCRYLVALRKGDHTAEHLKLDRSRMVGLTMAAESSQIKVNQGGSSLSNTLAAWLLAFFCLRPCHLIGYGQDRPEYGGDGIAPLGAAGVYSGCRPRSGSSRC